MFVRTCFLSVGSLDFVFSQVIPDATGTGGVVTVEVIKSMNTDTTDDFVPSVRTAFSDFKLAVEREEDGDFEGALSS